jgi:hypothetical protein
MRYSRYTPFAIAVIAAACNDSPTSPGELELGVAGATGRLAITATQSAEVLWEQRLEYDWTAQRYVSEIHVGHDMRLLPERDRVEILPGQTVWVTFQVDAQRRLASNAEVEGVRGKTCVTNRGRSAIKDFVIVEQVMSNVNGHLRPVHDATTILRVDEKLEPGLERCFDYEILFDVQEKIPYRVVAAVAAHAGAHSAALASADFELRSEVEKQTVEIDAEAWMRDGAFEACAKTLGPDFTCTSIEGIPRDQRIAPPTATGHLGMSFMVDIKNEGVCGQTFVYTIDEPLREGGPNPPGGEIREVSGSLVITTGPCPPAGDNCVLTAAMWQERYGDGSIAAVAAEYYGITLGEPGLDNKSLHISGPDLVRYVFARAGVSNPIGELYAQLYAAKLNIARGADPRPVRAARIAADAFLTTHNAEDWNSLTEAQQKAIVEWVKVLTDYNEGLNGPHRCGDDDDDEDSDDDEDTDDDVEGAGCTRTIGYWKNHAGFGPQRDVVTPLLPVWLGTAAGPKSVFVTSAMQAVTLLNMSGDASNGINKLYAQLLAARLNIKNGANGSAILQTLTQADVFLSTHTAADWVSLSAAERQRVLTWMSMLDDYNNGRLGPRQCD